MDELNKQQEFAELYAECEREILHYLLSVVPVHADALDVLQETATALWRRFSEYDRERPFGAWARTFAHMEVLRHRKTQSRRHVKIVTLSDETIEILAVEFAKHAGVVEWRQSALQECLKKLSENDLELARQRYWENTNLRDAARALGVSEHHFYRRLQRIRLQLQECIDARLAEETELS